MRIQCPVCSQRFNVEKDLLGKTVECGACDERFKVEDAVIVKEKKRYYPGEKKGDDLDRFTDSLVNASAPKGFQEAHYEPHIELEKLQPLRPRRVFASVAGIMIIVAVLAIFLTMGGETGALRDVETSKRFVSAGFAALLGCGLFIYGMAKNRKMSILLSLVMTAGLCSLPILFPGNPTAGSDHLDLNGESLVEVEEADRLVLNAKEVRRKYINEIGYTPVEEALAKSPKDQIIAIFLRDSSQLQREKIASFIFEATLQRDRGLIYERGFNDDHGLLVLSNQTKSIQEISSICSQWGKINHVKEDLRVIDVSVDRSKLITISSEEALDPDHMNFQKRNLELLDSMDSVERLNAVKRLGNSEPIAFRYDVVRSLIKMLPESSTELQLAIIKTLKKWSRPGEGAEAVVLAASKDIYQAGMLDRVTVEFLVERKVEGAAIVVMKLWEEDPVAWSDLLAQIGQSAEDLLLPKLKEFDLLHLVAAADILANVGSKASIPVLEEVRATKEGQSAKSLQAAIDEIQNRL
ncbi:MAG: hypothetical protein ACSHX0_03265 [Akkermansiaceae bacterium]